VDCLWKTTYALVVLRSDADRALAVAAELANNAFHNVTFFGGTLRDLITAAGASTVAVNH
jgi:hypothetical protein